MSQSIVFHIAPERDVHNIRTYSVTYMGGLCGTVGKRISFRVLQGKPIEVYWNATTHRGTSSARKFKTRKAAADWLISETVAGTRR